MIVECRHPGFLSPVKKELEYFNDDSRSVYSLEDYLSNWKWNRELDQNRMLYEFTPDYLPVGLRMMLISVNG